MNDSYLLMHRDEPCAVIGIDHDSGALTEAEIIHRESTPFLGNADERKLKLWWEHRAVPGSRREMEAIIRSAGCENSRGYLAKNLALSMTDNYWICPIELELCWEEVNLYRRTGENIGIVPLHDASSYDPNASLGGEMDKYWDISGSLPVLVKRAYRTYGQQSINEVFATAVHERQNAGIPFVRYEMKAGNDNAILSCCAAFTSEDVEFIPAYEVLHSIKHRASQSAFELYLNACEMHGIAREEMQRFMDYLIISDFAISNIDEHLRNFGVLRDARSMQLIGPAPIFDSGNSMFFNISGATPLQRLELLSQRINSFHQQEERMLRHVKDRKTFDSTKLPSAGEVRAFYAEHGMPDERADFIAGSYQVKRRLLEAFQQGENISLFLEGKRDSR